MKLQRSHIIIVVLLIAVLALLIFTIQQNTGGVAPTPQRTRVTGTVNSIQMKSNFSLVFFEDMKTRVTYGARVINSTGSPGTCRTQPCNYASISLYSNEQYNVTIEELVYTRVQGGNVVPDIPRYCQATPFPYTPTSPTETQSFVCNTNY